MTRPTIWKGCIEDFARTLEGNKISADDLVTLQERLLLLDPNGISDINLRVWINKLRVVAVYTTKNAKKGDIREDDHALNQSNHFNAINNPINNQIRNDNGKLKTDNAKSNAIHNPIHNPINNARTAEILNAKKADLIAKNKDHHESTFDERYVQELAEYALHQAKQIIDDDGFVHVCGGAGHDSSPDDLYPGDGAINAACQELFAGSSHRGDGTPNVVNKDGSFVTIQEVSERAERIGGEIRIIVWYDGFNFVNADALEKMIHNLIFDFYPHEHRKADDRVMFTYAGMGTCRPKGITVETPYPCYTAMLTCNKSMADVGIRRGTESDKKKRKRV